MANYGNIYTNTFASALKEGWSVSVLRRAYKGLTSLLKGGVEPFTVDFPDVSNTEDVLDIFDPIRASSFDMDLVAKDEFSIKESLYSEDNRKFKVVEQFEGGDHWLGWLHPYLSEEPYQSKPYKAKAGAIDGLSDLENNTFVKADGEGFMVQMPVTQAIIQCLSKTDLNLPVLIACEFYGVDHDQQKDALMQVELQPLLFVGDDGEPKDCLTVLKGILRTYSLVIFQQRAQWYIVQPHLFGVSGGVRHFKYDVAGNALGTVTLDPKRTICDHLQQSSDRLKVLAENPTSSFIPSLRKITVETEYGPLKNFLFNGRFRDLDSVISGGKIARGWRQYGTTYSFIEPDPKPTFRDHYLRIEGKYGRPVSEYTGISYVWAGGLNKPFPPASLQTPYAAHDQQMWISAPAVARYDQVIKVSGEYFNAGGKGIKIQVVAVPLVNTLLVPALKLDANTRLAYTDEDHTATLMMTQEGEWDYVSIAGTRFGAVILFDNTKEQREGDKLVNVAKGEWANFEIESKPLPVKHEKYTTRATYYTIRIVVFRVVEYEENKPKDQGVPYIIYRNLEIGIRDYLDNQDIRKERVSVERNNVNNVGKEWKEIKLTLGTVGGTQYYTQLLNPNTEPVTRFTRAGKGESLTLAHLTALTWLSQYRKSNLLYKLKLLGKALSYGLVFSLERSSKLFHLAGGSFERRSNQASIMMAELLSGTVSHVFKRWNINQNGKALLVESGNIEGDVVDEEADLRITFLEANGRNGNELTITGSVFAWNGGSFNVPAHDAYVAWWDQNQEGPYTVKVESLTNGEGVVDYEKTYGPIKGLRTKIEIPSGLVVRVTVTNQSGAKASRTIQADQNQKLQFAAPSSACVGKTPVVIGVLNNNYPIIRLSLIDAPLVRATYSMQAVDLATGQVVAGLEKIPLQFDIGTSWFEAHLPEEITTGVYGVIFIGKPKLKSIPPDRCGYIIELKRCKQTNPRWFGGRIAGRFKRQEVLS